MTETGMQEHLPAKSAGERYRSILKSTSLIGGASVLNILIGMVRTKFVAILLGPAGIGLLGMYVQITTLVGTATGMGIGSSGVRQVAEAVGTGDDIRIARIVITVRRTAWLTGGLGLLVMVVFCVPLSLVTFGTKEYALPITALGITLLTGAVAGGQGCVINGTRRIHDLAKISIIGAVSGTLISIPCLYFWEQAGIIPSLILSAFAALATSWWFARRIPVERIEFPWRDNIVEAKRLLALGISFMGTSLAVALTSYLIRIVMLRSFTIEDVGIYQAAYSLSGILVGFVLSAMGADYYPRLTAVAGDNSTVHRMVNEQTQISILLALPGLAAMMIFAPIVIQLFYAANFSNAVPILRWCVLGILGRVIIWPPWYILLAKGKGKTFFAIEVFGCTFHFIAVYICCLFWGLEGAGIAFMALNVVYIGVMFYIMRRLVGATWTRHTVNLILQAITVMVFLLLNSILNANQITAWIINLATLSTVIIVCFKQLAKITRIRPQDLLARFGIRSREV